MFHSVNQKLFPGSDGEMQMLGTSTFSDPDWNNFAGPDKVQLDPELKKEVLPLTFKKKLGKGGFGSVYQVESDSG